MKKRVLDVLAALICSAAFILPTFAASPSPFIGFSADGDGISVSVGGSTVSDDSSQAYGTLFSNYRTIAQVILGICVITAIISFLFQITKLGASGDNERLRRSAIVGILVSGLVLTVFGGLEIVVSVFWNVL